MPIHHVTNAMPNARNAQRKLYICYKGAPTHPTQEIKHTPSSPRKRVKVAWSRGLVKISASWSCVGTCIKAIFPFSTLSLRKWYLTSMCFVLEWSTGFFATLVALVLSCHTWFPKRNQVHLICAPGSVYTHMIYEMSEISLTVLKRNSEFNHLLHSCGRLEGL
jgi:hypothetical protein